MATKTTKAATAKATKTVNNGIHFDFFEGATNLRSNAPRITVRRGGVLVITPAALELLGDDVEFVQIGIDPKNNAIGIRKSLEGGRGRYRLQNQKSSRSKLIGSKRFFAHHGINADKAQTFDAELLTEGIIGFHLPQVAKQ